MSIKKIRRGDIVLISLDPTVGSEQGKTRPAVIIQNDIGNEFSPITIIAPITSKTYPKDFPTNVKLSPRNSGLKEFSTILLNQIRAVDKQRIIKILGHLDNEIIARVDNAIKISLGLE